MNTYVPSPIACVLSALSEQQRRLEQELLAEFRASIDVVSETDSGFRFRVSPDPSSLMRLGELLGLERLCCPFLSFELSLESERGPAILHVFGRAGVKDFVRGLLFL